MRQSFIYIQSWMTVKTQGKGAGHTLYIIPEPPAQSKHYLSNH